MPVLARTHFVFGAPFIVLGLVTLVLFIVVLVDMARRPQWQWRQAGSNKTMWIVLQVLLFVLFGFLSIVSGIVYLVAARPKLVAAERAGQAGGYGSPWQTGGYQGPPGGYGWPPPSGGYGAPPRPGEPTPGGYGTAPPYGAPPPAGGYEGATPTEQPTPTAQPTSTEQPTSTAQPTSTEQPTSTQQGAAPGPAPESDRTGEQGPPPYPGTFTQAPAPGEWSAAQSQVPASWQPDPTRRHELRYWDGIQWTEYVADGGTQSTDPVA